MSQHNLIKIRRSESANSELLIVITCRLVTTLTFFKKVFRVRPTEDVYYHK